MCLHAVVSEGLATLTVKSFDKHKFSFDSAKAGHVDGSGAWYCVFILLLGTKAWPKAVLAAVRNGKCSFTLK